MSWLSKVTVAQERDFERENVLRKKKSYLRNNPLDRYQEDQAYQSKIDQLKRGLDEILPPDLSGWVLDLGGNTGGEATVLLQQGIEIILSDINEVALEVAQARARHFGLRVPHCVSADCHALPFADKSFSAVMVIEALHHFDDYDLSLKEIFRCLQPGGGFLALEPNGWNLVRRLSEIRDRFRGTIEKSFTRRQLHCLLERAGFVSVRIEAVPAGRSKLRMADVPRYRRSFARFHAWLQRTYPRFFGAYLIVAFKPGAERSEALAWPEFLRRPGGGNEGVQFDGIAWKSQHGSYPDHEGIPVLIESDRLEDDT